MRQPADRQAAADQMNDPGGLALQFRQRHQDQSQRRVFDEIAVDAGAPGQFGIAAVAKADPDG